MKKSILFMVATMLILNSLVVTGMISGINP